MIDDSLIGTGVNKPERLQPIINYLARFDLHSNHEPEYRQIPSSGSLYMPDTRQGKVSTVDNR